MNRRTILTKTGKGLMEATGKTSNLSRDLRNVLKEIDGKVSVSVLLDRLDRFTEPRLLEALVGLERDGYLREFIGPQDAGGRAPAGRSPTSQAPEEPGEDLDFTAFTPAKPVSKEREDARSRTQSQETTRQALAARAREEAAARAKAEAAARARAEADQRARTPLQQPRPAARPADPATAQAQALDQARREAEERQRREGEEKARREAEARARVEAEERVKREAEERQRREMQEKALREGEEKARRDAEARARREAEERARKEVEDRRRREIEEKLRKEEVERRLREEDERARRETEEKERRLREEREHAERMTRIEAEARIKVEADERLRREQEERASREQEERRRREEELQRRTEEESRRRKEAAEREARERMKEQEEAARREIEEKIREEEERERREREERARREEEKSRAKDKEEASGPVEEEILGEEEIRDTREDEKRAKKDEKRAKEDEKRAREEEKRAKEEGKRAREEEKARAKKEAKAAEQARKAQRAKERAGEDAWRGDDAAVAAGRGRAVRTAADWAKRRSGSPAKQVAALLLIVLVVAVAVLPFVPLESGPYERAFQEWLGVPVKIGSTRVTLLPRPGLKFEKVVIGKDPQMRLAVVLAVPEIDSLTGDKKVFKRLELSGVVLPSGYVSALLSNKGNGNLLRVEHIATKGLKFDIPDLSLPPLDVDAKLGADGTVQSVVLSNAERRLSVILTPKGRRAGIEISADSLPLPIGGDLALGEFSAKGTLTAGELALNEVEGRAFGGRLLGNARLRWTDGWHLDGELSVRQLEAGQLAAPILAGGILEGKGVYGMRASALDKLFGSARLEGNFSIQKGSITNVDMTRLLQGSGTGGGTTLFSEMSGTVSADPNRLLVRQLRLAAGLLNGSGQVEMDPQKNLSGRLQIELRAQTVQARATLAVAGTLKNPQFRRGN